MAVMVLILALKMNTIPGTMGQSIPICAARPKVEVQPVIKEQLGDQSPHRIHFLLQPPSSHPAFCCPHVLKVSGCSDAEISCFIWDISSLAYRRRPAIIKIGYMGIPSSASIFSISSLESFQYLIYLFRAVPYTEVARLGSRRCFQRRCISTVLPWCFCQPRMSR